MRKYLNLMYQFVFLPVKGFCKTQYAQYKCSKYSYKATDESPLMPRKLETGHYSDRIKNIPRVESQKSSYINCYSTQN